MKKYILTLFTIAALLVNLTGCGGSGSSNPVTDTEKGGLATVRVSLSQNGAAVTDADSVALYTSAAAMREGVKQNENLSLGARAAVGPSNEDGVYKPISSADGNYEFNVPAGNYTFVASKGEKKAVLTGIRADVAETPAAVASLTQTGIIKGKVVDENSNAVAGAMAYLEGTSYVAFSGTDGSFEMTSVPTGTPFTVKAISTANGKHLISGKEDVTIDSTLVANLKSNIILKENTAKVMHITGSIVNSKGTGVSGKVAMAVNGNAMAICLSDSNGKYSIPVTANGAYIVSVLDIATPVTQSVTVRSADASVANFTITTAGQLASIRGRIKIDQNYLNRTTKLAPGESFLVKLVGPDYSTSTRASFNEAKFPTDGSEFAFIGIPAGTYSILVDPSGNGFYGSIAGITVAEGENLNISSKAVPAAYIRPTFSASWNGDELIVVEATPWIDIAKRDSYFDSAKLRICGKDINIFAQQLPTPTITGGDGQIPMVTATYNFSNTDYKSKTFDCVFLLENMWSDTNTNLSGTLIGESQICRHNAEAPLIEGDGLRYCRVKKDSRMTKIIRNSDGSFTAWDGSTGKADYYATEADAVAGNPTASLIFPGTIHCASNNYIFGDNGSSFVIQEISSDGGNTQALNPEQGYVAWNVYSADMLSGKYLTVSYIDRTNNTCFLDIYSLSDANEPTFVRKIQTSSEVTDNGIKCGNLAVDENGDVYTMLLNLQNNGGNYSANYAIYKLGNTPSEEKSTGSLGDCSSIGILVNDFKYLGGNRFFAELTLEDNNKSVIFDCNADAIVETAFNNDRKGCITDKHGYMYRLQKELKSSYGELWRLIRTTSLNGKAVSKNEDKRIIDLIDIIPDADGYETIYFTREEY